MSKVQNPIIGRASKQAGGMVFSTVYGQNVMRAKPFEITAKKTPKQINQQKRFDGGNELASKVKAHMSLIYPKTPQKFSAFNLLVKQSISALVEDNNEWKLKPSLFILGNGTLPDVSGTFNFNSIVLWTLIYEYYNHLYDSLIKPGDTVKCMIHNAALDSSYIVDCTHNPVAHTFSLVIPEPCRNAQCFVSEPIVTLNSLKNATKFYFSKSDNPTLLTSIDE